MFCPNCGSSLIGNEESCLDCDMELVWVKGHVLIRDHYIEVKEVHNTFDNFISQCETVVNHISSILDDDTVFSELSTDSPEYKEFQEEANSSKDDLSSFKKNMNNLLNNYEYINYIRSMNFVFGDIDTKIGRCRYLINSYFKHVDTFYEKMKNNEVKNEKEDDTIITVEEYHSQIDELISNVNSVYEMFGTQLQKQVIYEELRTDNEGRQSIKTSINESLDSLENFEKQINENLQPKRLKELKKQDTHGDIEEKLVECQNKIYIVKKLLNECLDRIHSIENPENNNIPLNNKRILDI